MLFLTISISVKAQLQGEPLFSFGVVADVQHADIDNSGTRHYRSSPAKLSEAVAVFNRQGVDYVISLGDFINDKLEGYETLNSITSKLESPLYHVAGNHDFNLKESGADATLRYMNLKRLHYSFAKEGWRFVVLNGNDLSVYANRSGSKQYKEAEAMIAEMKARKLPNAQTWNGAIGRNQLRWLEKELKQARKKQERVILACHFPLVTQKKGELLLNSDEVLGLIQKYPGVFAYLNGHGHTSQHNREGGVHHVMFRGMVEMDDNAFSILKVYPDRIEMEGFGKEQGRVLK
jgi:predicted phosphodiesterase